MFLSPIFQDALKILTLLLLLAVLVVDPVAANPTDDRDGDGIVDTVDLDDDNDGIPDVFEIDENGQERDSDLDGMPDRLDLDSDNDGILDVAESGIFISLSLPGIRIVNGRLLTDVGENGIADIIETSVDSNQPAYTLLNTDEADGDVVPDYLDLDSDNDGILDLIEAGVTAALDSDNNGRIDGGPGSVGNDGILDLAQINNDQNCCDYDLDGIGDEIPRNTDGGDLPDYQDLDSDNDGINDLIEAGGNDRDQDGRIDSFFDDANNPDGVDDQLFLIPLGLPDSDGDGVPDFRDASVQFVPSPAELAEPAEPAVEETVSSEPIDNDTNDTSGGDATPLQADDTQPQPAENPAQVSDDATTADATAIDQGIIETGLGGGVGCSLPSPIASGNGSAFAGQRGAVPRDIGLLLLTIGAALHLFIQHARRRRARRPGVMKRQVQL